MEFSISSYPWHGYFSLFQKSVVYKEKNYIKYYSPS